MTPTTKTNRSNSIQVKVFHVWIEFFDEFSKEKEFKCLQNDLDNVIGMKSIRESSQNYANIDAMLTEIVRSAEGFMEHFEGTHAGKYEKAEEFKKQCEIQADIIKKCPFCYESWRNDKSKKQTAYFKLVCTHPHLLIFMKVDGYPIWPAKLFYVKDGIANVECFGDYLQDDIPISQCFLYSQRIPYERANDKRKQAKLSVAYKEVAEHIKLIEEKFGAGSFVPATSKIPVTNLEQHLKDMFPAVYAQRAATTSDLTHASSTRAQRESEPTLIRGSSTANRSATSYGRNNAENVNDSSIENGENADHYNDLSDNDSNELDYQNHDTPPQIKSENSFEIEDVVGNYSGHDGAQDDNLHEDNGGNDNQPTLEVKDENTSNNGRKRRHAALRSRTNTVPNKRIRAAKIGNSSRVDEGEIITLDDDDNEETNATPNNKERALNEYKNVVERIFDLKAKVEMLEKQKEKLEGVILSK